MANLTNQPIVIDNGSGTIKAGIAGGTQPTCFFNNTVGRPKHARVMAGAIEGDHFVGKEAQELRGLLKLKYPMEHGIVTDWDDMQRVWKYTFSQMHVHPEDHPVLLTEAPLNPRKNREKAAEIFFETFNAPALFISMQAILSLYASGRTTGVVVDIGDGVTHVVPIYQGFGLPHAVMRTDVAGRDVTDYLQLLLRRSGCGYNFHTSAEKEVVRQIKEQVCYVAGDPDKEEEALELQERSAPSSSSSSSSAGAGGAASAGGSASSSSSSPSGQGAAGGNSAGGAKNARGVGQGLVDFRLPDGHVISIGPEAFRAPEVLFRPDLIGEEFPGLSELVANSINRTDLDLRRNLYGNILLSGGSTLFPGFGDRLLKDIIATAPKDTKIKISAPPERQFSTWIGGSILAALPTFKKMWVWREEYDEDGMRVLHRKTF